MKFTPVIGLKNLKSHRTFESAFRAFHAEFHKQVERLDTIPVAWLNGCWIESDSRPIPYFFDDIVMFAHEAGWLKDGKIQPPKTVHGPRAIGKSK
jgi:hypothetical protein